MEQASCEGNQRSFTLRDGAILIGLSIVATYLLRVQHSFELVPSWRHEVTTGYYEERDHVGPLKKLPTPLVADIESDGRNEILIATKDPSLLLLKTTNPPLGSKALPYLRLVDEFSLLSGDAEDKDASHERRRPVAMATGFVEPLLSDGQVRKQVIVVLCADWTVVCLTSDFKLLWTTKLPNTTWSPQHVISEAAILILPHSLQPKDGGLVIIGGRLIDPLAHLTLRHSHDHEDDKHVAANSKEASRDVGHFSTFALSGNHGDVRWHHLPGDFEEEANSEEELFKGIHFKLNLKKGWGHRGEQGWSQYSQAFIDQMPFRWQSSADTRIDVAEWRKDGVGRSQKEDDGVPSVSSFLASSFEEHIAGHHFGGLPPHSAAEHIKNPNTVVIHSQEGIEVLQLKTGRPLTRLSLASDSSYSDLNKDGVIDQARAQFSVSPSDNCQAVVRSGYPPHSLLFNGSICYPPSLWAALSYPWAYVSGKSEVKENQALSLRPLLVKSVAKQRGVIGHLLGLSMTRSGMDSIYAVSNGQVTSYGPSGHFNWQVSTAAGWSENYIVNMVRGQVDDVLKEMYHNAFMPSIKSFPVQEYGKKTAAAIAGWDNLALLSLETGNVLAEHTLPCQPTAPLIVGDFNDDGLNDVIVQCTHSYLGFTVQRYSGYWATAFIGLAVVVIVTTLVATCTPKETPIEGTEHGEDHDHGS